MTVRRILQSKGNQEILTISPTAKVSEAAKMLSELRIGALVVSRGEAKIDGILSERDIVAALGKRGPGCLDDGVADMMTASVKTIDPDRTAVEALQLMTDGRFRHIPVVEDDKMVGVISIGDVVKYRIAEMEHENTALTEMIVGHG